MISPAPLPVAVRDYPYWRVLIRPGQYDPQRIPTLSECFDVAQKNKVRLRGWDFPHVSQKPAQRGQGPNWVASWADFMGHIEYWRMYQSGQFLHLHTVREAVEEDWREKLRATTRGHLSYLGDEVDWDSVPGFIDVVNLLYKVTEVFEFAARLAQHDVLQGQVTVAIEVTGIEGFVLTVDSGRGWSEYRAATEDRLGNEWVVDSDELVSGSSGRALAAAGWFYERFGWLSPALEALQKDQEKFLKGRL